MMEAQIPNSARKNTDLREPLLILVQQATVTPHH